MAAKILLVIALFVYLILVSLVCAYTYPESDVTIFGESVFYEPESIENVSMSTALNLSDLQLIITKGRWVLDTGCLKSDDKKENEFFIELYYGGGDTSYNCTGVDENFILYFYRSVDSFVGREDRYGYYFDLKNDVLAFVSAGRYFYIFETRTVLESVPFTLGDTHPNITISLSLIPGGTPEEGGVYSSVAVDGNVLLSENYPEKYNDAGFCAGVFVEKKGFRVSIDREVTGSDRVESELGFNIIPIMVKLIFYHAPELALPLWLNLIMFKMPVLAAVLVVITIIRGV